MANPPSSEVPQRNDSRSPKPGEGGGSSENSEIYRYRSEYLFAGPIPDPAAIRAYEESLPGAADRIFKMAEEQSSHRRKIEAQVVEGALSREKLGQWMAFALFLATLVGGFVLVALGKDITGIVALVTAVAGPLGLFIYEKKAGRKDLARKRESAQDTAKNSFEEQAEENR